MASSKSAKSGSSKSPKKEEKQKIEEVHSEGASAAGLGKLLEQLDKAKEKAKQGEQFLRQVQELDPLEMRVAAREKLHNIKPVPWWQELILVLVTALAISWGVKTFLIQPFYIPSISMENTLMVNDRILVTKMAPHWRDLNRGDIIVFKDTEGWLSKEERAEQAGKSNAISNSAIGRGFQAVFAFLGLVPEDSSQYLVKRVIGLPGDHVECCNVQGQLSINGKPIDEGYLPEGMEPSLEHFDVTVAPKSVWVMGDNRSHSADSRAHMDSPSHGMVPLKDVVGRAFVRVWPMDRVKLLANSCAFYNIPEPGELPKSKHKTRNR